MSLFSPSDETEFMTCYGSCHRELAAYCNVLSRDPEDAKDLMSDTIEIGFRKFSSLKDRTKFKLYLFGIASKLFQNRLRTIYKRKNESLDNVVSFRQEVQTERHMDYKIALDTIKKLAPDQQEAILLFEVSGFSIQEIATIQNTNENTIKTRLSRAREKLRTLLAEPKLNTSHGKL